LTMTLLAVRGGCRATLTTELPTARGVEWDACIGPGEWMVWVCIMGPGKAGWASWAGWACWASWAGWATWATWAGWAGMIGA
jgi:hypothetical protein